MMMVASGAVAGVKENAAAVKSNAAKIERVQEDISAVKARVEEIRDKQNADSGRMWFERTKEQAEHVKDWAETQRNNIDLFYNALIWISAIAALLLTVIGFAFHKGQKQLALKNQNEFEKKAENIIAEMKKNVSSQQSDFNVLADKTGDLVKNKEQEIEKLVETCRKHAKTCATHKENAEKDSLAIKIARDSNIDKERTEEETQALSEVSNDEEAPIYDRLRAKAIQFCDSKKWEEAINVLKTMSLLESNKAEPYVALGYVYGEQAKDAPSLTNKVILLNLAEKQYKKATEIDENKSGAWNNWGNLIAGKYKTAAEEQKEALFIDAQDKYKKAIDTNEKNSDAWNNWGNLIADKYETATEEQKEALFIEAQDKYKKSTDTNEKNSDAWNNWGILISSRYETAKKEQREALFIDAQNKYKKATEVDENYSGAWYNWGLLIADKYKNAEEEQKEALFIDAQDKYKKATEIDENDSSAWSNWGNLLILEAARNPNKIDNSLLKEAKEKCLKAESIKVGYGAYNLACISSLQEDFEACQKWFLLRKKSEASLPHYEHLINDTDLDNFKNDPEYKQWFEDFLEEVRREEQEAKGDDHQNTESEPEQE
ncbi:tetratricopeptide repeat protein [Desulfovibrio gilichinskyi]|uniref:tetratricopeptide repeat protein n=1 Tax=Desulfovibrio gilichinskyi TaxID=1519643 RepID=UPI0010F9A1E8|nr:hypothetical protein [Desulfovibrio gilichinskyi]